ncbi:hypothetical protein E2F50_19930 [Rhizobium deserti]|uniref:Uncharacterized protein n=1 Tax=Rhizobium deserti TaxID=2547961 RepID=A0A4R5U9D0_9HYPH|nr:hypothetical protein [Rhizobium deserti]TDK31224.1 hypothetical protein E2F50_19930 [Rhizobium deserti]
MLPETDKDASKTKFMNAVKLVECAPYAAALREIVKPVKSGMSWPEALETILSGLAVYDLTYEKVRDVKLGARECPDDDVRAEFIDRLEAWQFQHLQKFKGQAREDAIANIGRRGYGHDDFDRLVFVWPHLKDDGEFLDRALQHTLMSSGSDFHECLRDLALLNGSLASLRVVMESASIKGLLFSPWMVELINAWQGNILWAQLMLALLSEDHRARGTEAIRALADVVLQLPMAGFKSSGLSLERLSGASRKAWRGHFAELAAKDRELGEAATEALLWFAADSEDRFVQLAVIQADPAIGDKSLERSRHPSPRVRLRARSAVEMIEGRPDPVYEMLAAFGPSRPRITSRRESRTWLGNAGVEQILVGAFSQAAETLADEVRSTASAGEETLVAKLFERLKNYSEQATRYGRDFARELDLPEFADVALDHRFVGKKEEGAEGLVEGASFSTDVTLILKASKNGKTFAERAVFIQAKRMFRGANAAGEYYEVDMKQLRDLVKQPSSFLLFVGPRTGGVTMPVIPARLFEERFDNGSNTKRPPIGTVAANGRNLAEWLVDDVIGLWTGESDSAAVEKARRGGGDTATLLVELSVTLKRVETED